MTQASAERDIRIDPEVRDSIPPPAEEERARLEHSLLAEGCRDALAVWKGHGILLDGHTRYDLCCKHGISFRVREVELPDRAAALDWVRANQLGRRNLTPRWARYLRGRLYLAAKQSQGGSRKSSGQSDHLTTAERLAAQYGVSPVTVRRDARFARRADQIGEAHGPEARRRFLAGEHDGEWEAGPASSRPAEARPASEGAGVVVAPGPEEQAAPERPDGPKKGQAGKARAAAASPAPAAPAAPVESTIEVPAGPAEATARALVEILGPEKAAQVQRALRQALEAKREEARPRRPGPCRPRKECWGMGMGMDRLGL